MDLIIKVPELQFTNLKPYEHREKHIYSTGTHGHISKKGRITTHTTYARSITVSDAWRIGFTNISSEPVHVTLTFSIYDEYGKLEDFDETFSNVRPKESVDSFIRPQAKKVMFTNVAVFTTDLQLLSNTEVKQFLPAKPWVVKSWMMALVMALISSAALTGAPPANDHNAVSLILPFFTLLVMGYGMVKRTPVILMLILVALIPFSDHSIDVRLVLMALGGAYLYLVWKKRGSLYDFLRTSSSPRPQYV